MKKGTSIKHNNVILIYQENIINFEGHVLSKY